MRSRSADRVDDRSPIARYARMMTPKEKTPDRRSAGDWRRIIDAWRESGLTAAEFGAKHNIEKARLTWWKWHLGRSEKKRAQSSTLKLMEVAVTREPGNVQWELRTAAGDTLRVNELLTLDELQTILRAFGLRGRH